LLMLSCRYCAECTGLYLQKTQAADTGVTGMQCTWAQSGTVGWRYMARLGRAAGPLMWWLSRSWSWSWSMWGSSGSTRSCSRERRARDTLNSLKVRSIAQRIVVGNCCVCLDNMLIGLCGGKHPVGHVEQSLTASRHLRREVVDSLIPHRGAWLQAAPSRPHCCHSRRREVSVRRPRTLPISLRPRRPHFRRHRRLARVCHVEMERAMGDDRHMGRQGSRCTASPALLPPHQRRRTRQRAVAALQRPLCRQQPDPTHP
jgi:hypothetical protein